jgi:hypothetical protein
MRLSSVDFGCPRHHGHLTQCLKGMFLIRDQIGMRVMACAQ